jgi:hypothetical protein
VWRLDLIIGGKEAPVVRLGEHVGCLVARGRHPVPDKFFVIRLNLNCFIVGIRLEEGLISVSPDVVVNIERQIGLGTSMFLLRNINMINEPGYQNSGKQFGAAPRQ